MFVPRILLKANFSIARLKVETCARQWTPTPAYDALVDAEWQALVRSARQPIWDGICDRVLDPASLAGGAMRLGTIRYRYVATYPALAAQHAQSGLEPLNHLSTIALIRTRDGHYLFGRRTRNGAVELIGGGVQRDQIAVAVGGDLERNLLKEMREEVGIVQEDIASLVGIGIVSASTSNILIVAHAQSRLSQAEALRRFAERTEDEMSEPVFVAAAELHSILAGMEDYRPLIAALP